eukprot:TRINITY_DN32846_c0_g1_i1.p1 TRINITY_DN32846_c0_g1~~TRINITY_DN32846_c0_g1_i1.p1  ORF type:complete len:477 (-),score=101.68 TRINITY_DN32846_c0_g1_i1:26-1456(-)
MNLFILGALFATLAVHAVPRVAIVGAGINGGSAAHFLREALGDDGVDITVYEVGPEPGGRTMTRSFANVTVDVGGTAIYSKNRYMAAFVQDFGLQQQGDEPGVNSHIGIWDGRHLRVEVDADSALSAGLKLVLRYGLSPRHVIPAVRKAVEKFDKIYELQAENRSFASPEELLRALGVFDLTQVSAYDYFKGLDVNEAFVKELIDGASRCNYNQPGTLNSFADLISLAGAGVGGHVFSLANGTQAVSRGLLEAATRTRLAERVERIEASGSAAGEGYVVHSRSNHSERAEHFDGVIIATPLEMAAITLPPEVENLTGSGREYQTTHVTFVHGTLNRSFFKPHALNQEIPAQVLTTQDSTSAFSSFGMHRVFADGSAVVKLFSQRELTLDDLTLLFPQVHDVYRYAWKAYPKLQPLAPERWASFTLAPRLFYTSGLETSASAMEVAAIAGRNGALLMQKALLRDHSVPPVSETAVLV